MAPKKGQKMSLNAFLEEQSLGSWADEMDALPSAPAQKTDEERARMNERGFDRRGDRDYGGRPERPQPAREELPLPTEPPYTAFVGNLPFDLTEDELGAFFAPAPTKSVKIIRDRDDKPKGFGYVEFEELDGLKGALEKSGSAFQSRTIRISVAAPPQKGAGGFGDDEKTSGPWRRDGPLPDRPGSRSRFDDGGGSRFREERPPSQAEANTDWRANRPPPAPPRAESDVPRPPRRTGFAGPPPERGEPSAADSAEDWTIGSKFKPSASAPGEGGPPPSRGRFGSGRGDFGGITPPRREPTASDGGDWRSSMRGRQDTQEKSPTTSTPPTPQMGRRKLELMPRSSSQSNSAANTPLSSPKLPSATANRPNPFGAAKPVDVSARESEVAERVEKEREEIAKTVAAEKEKHAVTRSSSRTARERDNREPSSPTVASPTDAAAPPASPVKSTSSQSSNVRPSFSFANAAAATGSGKGTLPASQTIDVPESVPEEQKEYDDAVASSDPVVTDVSERLGEVTI